MLLLPVTLECHLIIINSYNAFGSVCFVPQTIEFAMFWNRIRRPPAICQECCQCLFVINSKTPKFCLMANITGIYIIHHFRTNNAFMPHLFIMVKNFVKLYQLCFFLIFQKVLFINKFVIKFFRHTICTHNIHKCLYINLFLIFFLESIFNKIFKIN